MNTSGYPEERITIKNNNQTEEPDSTRAFGTILSFFIIGIIIIAAAIWLM